MNRNTTNDLQAAQATLSQIIKLAVDGWRDGRLDIFVDIRTKADEALSDLAMLEADLMHPKLKRRKYEQTLER
jgi:hypothetical protein